MLCSVLSMVVCCVACVGVRRIYDSFMCTFTHTDHTRSLSLGCTSLAYLIFPYIEWPYSVRGVEQAAPGDHPSCVCESPLQQQDVGVAGAGKHRDVSPGVPPPWDSSLRAVRDGRSVRIRRRRREEGEVKGRRAGGESEWGEWDERREV